MIIPLVVPEIYKLKTNLRTNKMSKNKSKPYNEKNLHKQTS